VILGSIITGAMGYATLTNKVDAMTDREQANKQAFLHVATTVEDIRLLVQEIHTNQKHIMRELGID